MLTSDIYFDKNKTLDDFLDQIINLYNDGKFKKVIFCSNRYLEKMDFLLSDIRNQKSLKLEV